ncbi:MAG: cell division protein ZapA [Gammaproteobacteria bacterium]|nr:cell division protein ZapA [Gammaproteobacteria bacterium]
MADSRERVKVQVLNKSFVMTCKPEEVEGVEMAGRRLNTKLEELVGDQSSTDEHFIGNLVAVALGLIHETEEKDNRLAQMELRLSEILRRLDDGNLVA